MEEEEEKWSQLPTLLIWMIKDRLTYIGDHSSIVSVCKNWKDASESWPSKSIHQRCIAPWLYLGCVHRKKAVFVNVSTEEKLVLDIPELLHPTDILFSRKGWLLCFGGYKHPVVLLNFHTSAKIVMPYPAAHLEISIASFSASDDDTPRDVVLVVYNDYRRCMEIYKARVGDKRWNLQSYSYVNGRRLEAPASLVVRGLKAYCLDCRGGLLIFDMVNLSVQELVVNTDHITCHDSYWKWWIMESEEGWVVKIGHSENSRASCFFKLNESQTSWEELSQNEKGRSWFFHDKNNNHFTAKENPGVKKAYCLTKDINNAEFVTVHDLVDRSVNYYNPPKFNYAVCRWVDLGPIYKKPLSCVRYAFSKSLLNGFS